MVEIAGKNAAEAGVSERVKFQYGSAEKIPCVDGSFDLVLAYQMNALDPIAPLACHFSTSRPVHAGPGACLY